MHRSFASLRMTTQQKEPGLRRPPSITGNPPPICVQLRSHGVPILHADNQIGRRSVSSSHATTLRRRLERSLLASGHENADLTTDELKNCNLGYASNCSRLPRDRASDAIRFSVARD